MIYDSTKALLGSIIRSLDTADEAAWDDRLELGKECLYEMSQMTRPSYQPCRQDYSDTQWESHIPDSKKAIQAMPHVRAMMSAIRHRDQATALECAKAALAEM
jgi:hypothetical protein